MKAVVITPAYLSLHVNNFIKAKTRLTKVVIKSL